MRSHLEELLLTATPATGFLLVMFSVEYPYKLHFIGKGFPQLVIKIF